MTWSPWSQTYILKDPEPKINTIIATTLKKQDVWGFFHPGRPTDTYSWTNQIKKHKPMSSAYSTLDVLQVIRVTPNAVLALILYHENWASIFGRVCCCIWAWIELWWIIKLTEETLVILFAIPHFQSFGWCIELLINIVCTDQWIWGRSSQSGVVLCSQTWLRHSGADHALCGADSYAPWLCALSISGQVLQSHSKRTDLQEQFCASPESWGLPDLSEVWQLLYERIKGKNKV